MDVERKGICLILFEERRLDNPSVNKVITSALVKYLTYLTLRQAISCAILQIRQNQRGSLCCIRFHGCSWANREKQRVIKKAGAADKKLVTA